MRTNDESALDSRLKAADYLAELGFSWRFLLFFPQPKIFAFIPDTEEPAEISAQQKTVY